MSSNVYFVRLNIPGLLRTMHYNRTIWTVCTKIRAESSLAATIYGGNFLHKGSFSGALPSLTLNSGNLSTHTQVISEGWE